MPTRRRAAGLGSLSLLASVLAVVGGVPTAQADHAAGRTTPPPPPKPRVSISDVTVTESDAAGGVATFKVTLRKGDGSKVRVRYLTKNGTATWPGDYEAASGKLVFKGAKKTQRRTISIPIVGDDVVEPDETFTVVLTKIKGGRLKRSTGRATIENDDVALPTYSLQVTKDGAGTGSVTSDPEGVDCGPDCSGTYVQGTEVTLTAAPATGSAFTGWSGACTGTGSCVVTMDDAKSVGATFALQSFSLSVIKTGGGSGAVTSSPAGISCGATCSASYDYATTVTLTATPLSGSVFTGWSGGGCSGVGSCQVSMTQATTVSANFSLQTFTLTVNKGGMGTVTSSPQGISCGADCSEDYTFATMVALTATPSPGSFFTGWGGACSGTGGCTVSMNAAKTVTATFAS